jgi:enolase
MVCADRQRHLGGTLHDLDGTPGRSASGANALLGVSMAPARAAALSVGIAVLTAESGIQIVGDDLFVTNLDRLRRGIEQGAANALLRNVNQVGTLSEALDAAALATGSGFGRCVSEWSGETEDSIIADLVVALGAGQSKTGAPVRGERTANHNGLLQIEEELGSCARYPGISFPRPG